MVSSSHYKRDSFGSVTRELGAGGAVVRDTTTASRWARPLARHLAQREAAALEHVGHLEGVPALLAFDGRRLRREHIAGSAMPFAAPRSAAYFRDALRLLQRVHRCGVAHNDLAKEANWLCTPRGRAAIVDFQLAYISPRRTKLFRVLAREDLRHLLKHKRQYLPERLTRRERALLAAPALTTRIWRILVKPPYRWITRGVLGWSERVGPEERQRPPDAR